MLYWDFTEVDTIGNAPGVLSGAIDRAWSGKAGVGGPATLCVVFDIQRLPAVEDKERANRAFLSEDKGTHTHTEKHVYLYCTL